MNVAVVGAAGYAGGELLRLLLAHPKVSGCTAMSRSQAGKGLGEIHPGLAGVTDASFAPLELDGIARSHDVIFLALEHGESARIAPVLFAQSPQLVIDLAADFRVADLPLYERYYGAHPAPELLPRFRYGLADVASTELAGAGAIAVPGCFATAAQLALFPLAAVTSSAPVLFAITGSSGSGAQPKATTHHPVRANNVFAYSVLGHRHEAEIVSQWRQWTGREDLAPRLMTHSGPFVRGIYLTLAARRNPGDTAPPDARSLFHDTYGDRPFIRLLENPPELTHVVGTNYALIHVAQSDDGAEIQVSVAIDNLIKGASGQAVQSMNLALGLAEDVGLRVGGMFPC
jgi:N-acetyl-gamma-glutamyl-phosphate reductase